MCSLFWRHRDFPSVALIDSALMMRWKKEQHFSHWKNMKGEFCMSFVPALILTHLYLFSPPEVQQDNLVLSGSQSLILALLGLLFTGQCSSSLESFMAYPDPHFLKVWGCCYENTGLWLKAKCFRLEKGTKGAATSRWKKHGDINKVTASLWFK